jgi:hypothetical protein
VAWNDIVATGGGGGEDPSPQSIDELSDYPAAGSAASTDPRHVGTGTMATGELAKPSADKLVIEGAISMHADNVSAVASAIRARVEQGGGYVVSENIYGSESAATSASLSVRVPPSQASSLADWLGTLGTVTGKQMTATEVSKTLFDQELAIKNLELTMGRLQALAEKGGTIEVVLSIEKELTRVRGELEAVKGEQRYLLDRVAYATMSVSITRDGDPEELDLVPEARIYPGPIVTTLSLIDPGTRQHTRLGGGASLRVSRALTFDLAVFPRGDGGDSRAVVATIGTALYSGYLGYGQRRFFNPYVGGRVGYGYLSDESGLALAAELGIEWFKHRYLLVDSAVRAIAFVREPGNEAAIQATLGVAVPF